jgi:hypothetical protein
MSEMRKANVEFNITRVENSPLVQISVEEDGEHLVCWQLQPEAARRLGTAMVVTADEIIDSVCDRLLKEP